MIIVITLKINILNDSIFLTFLISAHGFDSTQAGLFGSALVFSGLIVTSILSPIMGRYCPSTCVQILKIFGPLIGLSYAGLVWILKGRDMGGVYLTNILIGIFSL